MVEQFANTSAAGGHWTAQRAQDDGRWLLKKWANEDYKIYIF